MKNRVTINIFGDTYTVMDADDENYVISLSKEVDAYMLNINKKGNFSNKTKVAVLAAFNLLDSLKKTEKMLKNKTKEAEYLKKLNDSYLAASYEEKTAADISIDSKETELLREENKNLKDELDKLKKDLDKANRTVTNLQNRNFANQIELLKLKKQQDMNK